MSMTFPSLLKQAGVTHILSVNGFDPRLIGFTVKVVLLDDEEDQDIISFIPECIDFINNSCKVLIFCCAGRSRSASILAAYLIKQHSMSYSQAL